MKIDESIGPRSEEDTMHHNHQGSRSEMTRESLAASLVASYDKVRRTELLSLRCRGGY